MVRKYYVRTNDEYGEVWLGIVLASSHNIAMKKARKAFSVRPLLVCLKHQMDQRYGCEIRTLRGLVRK